MLIYMQIYTLRITMYRIPIATRVRDVSRRNNKNKIYIWEYTAAKREKNSKKLNKV